MAMLAPNRAGREGQNGNEWRTAPSDSPSQEPAACSNESPAGHRRPSCRKPVIRASDDTTNATAAKTMIGLTTDLAWPTGQGYCGTMAMALVRNVSMTLEHLVS
jgi:hypothetical protein